MAITADDVKKVALLARLSISDDQLPAFTKELAAVVEYVDQLGEVDTTDVVPMAHAAELRNITKADTVESSLDRQAALANAPNHNNEGYLVPAVLGD